MQVLHIGLGYFKVTLHVGISFKIKYSFKGIQTIYMGILKRPCMWVLHLGLIFHLNL